MDGVGLCRVDQREGRRVAGLVDELCKGRRGGNFSVSASRETDRSFRPLQALLSEAQVVCEERHCCLPAVQGRIAFSPSLPLPFALSLASPHV